MQFLNQSFKLNVSLKSRMQDCMYLRHISEQVKEGALLFNMRQCILMPHVKNINKNVSER